MQIEMKKNLAHLGGILFNYALLGIFILLGITFSQIFLILYYMILLMAALLTLGVALLSEQFRQLWQVGENFNEFLKQAEGYMPVVAGVFGTILVLSFFLLCFDFDQKNNKLKLILSVLMFIIFIGVLIVFGGKAHA